jgi:hypothetical protein
MQTILGIAILTSLISTPARHWQTLVPTPIPTKVTHSQWMIKASVAGKEGWYVLSTASKTSSRLPRPGESGPDGRQQSADVAIGGVDGGSVKFRIVTSTALKALGVDGVLGADALAYFTLALDIEDAQAAIWSDTPSLLGQRGWILLLPALGNSTQHATTLSIDDVDKMPSPPIRLPSMECRLAKWVRFGCSQANPERPCHMPPAMRSPAFH